jgi:hypothetical protein
MIEFTKIDLARMDTILKMVRRGKYELEGEEVLAFAQAYAWAMTTMDRMKASLEAPEPVVKSKAKVRGEKSQ